MHSVKEEPSQSDTPSDNGSHDGQARGVGTRLSGLILEGKIRDYAELARIGHVTRARVTKIMTLLGLSPEIQEQLLFQEEEKEGSTVFERDMRAIAAQSAWAQQRTMPRK
jgi:hypothetical protein